MSDFEKYVRGLRDKVFGAPTTDNNWAACKDKWMAADSVKWLEEKAKVKGTK